MNAFCVFDFYSFVCAMYDAHKDPISASAIRIIVCAVTMRGMQGSALLWPLALGPDPH